MVGYNKNDTMTQNQKLIAGVVSGMMTRFITQPMDVVKLRTQLAKTKHVKDKTKFNLIRTTRKILKEEGIMAFWTGHTLGQIHSVVSVSAQFFTYEQATKLVATSNIDAKYKPFLTFISGIFAGCVSAALVVPIEVIRVRQMLVQDQYKGIINGARRVYKNGGIFAFYEGLNASLCQMGPQVGIAFSVFRFLQPRLLYHFNCFSTNHCLNKSDSSNNEKDGSNHKSDGSNQKSESSDHVMDGINHKSDGSNLKDKNHVGPEAVLFASSIAGSVAGFVSKTATYPFDLAKRRMQILSHRSDDRFETPSTSKDLFKCKTLSQCLIRTYQKEGFVGLFRGWKVTVYKAQMTSVSAFTTYELSCYFIREFSH